MADSLSGCSGTQDLTLTICKRYTSDKWLRVASVGGYHITEDIAISCEDNVVRIFSAKLIYNVNSNKLAADYYTLAVISLADPRMFEKIDKYITPLHKLSK